MKNKKYWSYNQRYPMGGAQTEMADRLRRLIDHVDDSMVSLMVELEYFRIRNIERRLSRLHNRHIHREAYVNPGFAGNRSDRSSTSRAAV